MTAASFGNVEKSDTLEAIVAMYPLAAQKGAHTEAVEKQKELQDEGQEAQPTG